MRQPNQKGLYNKATIQYDEAEIATAASECDNHIVYKCEKELPKDILNLENEVLQQPLSVENVLKRKVEIPDSVKNFYKALCTGEDEAKKQYLQENSDLLSQVLQMPYIHVPVGNFSLENVYH